MCGRATRCSRRIRDERCLRLLARRRAGGVRPTGRGAGRSARRRRSGAGPVRVGQRSRRQSRRGARTARHTRAAGGAELRLGRAHRRGPATARPRSLSRGGRRSHRRRSRALDRPHRAGRLLHPDRSGRGREFGAAAAARRGGPGRTPVECRRPDLVVDTQRAVRAVRSFAIGSAARAGCRRGPLSRRRLRRRRRCARASLRCADAPRPAERGTTQRLVAPQRPGRSAAGRGGRHRAHAADPVHQPDHPLSSSPCRGAPARCRRRRR